ncbi:VIT1/CCC1 transporter family protein [Liquorilactobacillus sicerae]|uniref:VIT1/CCC1 transporter family protein n=1 Tax=Liquorilactobacillus sicerae TaxID=1416943 RepID=UPI002480E18E|nr:VIT family protein [Liquorilactobacillus sicerae]
MKNRSLAQKVNVMRAAVMGANDGILSVAGIVIGVAGATTSNYAVFLAGISGMLAGTVSMAMGEYVSVNTQKDSQKKAVIEQKLSLENDFEKQFEFVKQRYLDQGIKEELAEKATSEMMGKDPLVTVVREKYGFDPQQFTSPYAAALASMISFPLGSVLPLAAILLFPASTRILATFLAVMIALVITGWIAAVLGHANWKHGIARNVISGALTMMVTYVIGVLIGR